MNIEEPWQLIPYLREKRLIPQNSVPDISILAGGVSNRTVLVKPRVQSPIVLKQALEKLRVSVDWFSAPERVHREALGLHWMERIAPRGSAPVLLHEDRKLHIIAMSAVPSPHANFKQLLLDGRIEHEYVRQFAQLLGTIHANGARLRTEAEEVFGDQHFFNSLRLEPYYGFTSQQVPEATAFLGGLIERTKSRKITIVHGDYSPKNVLIHQDRLVLLDYEVIHFGDPSFDLGFALTHLLSKANHLAHSRNEFGKAAKLFWRTYETIVQGLPWSQTLEAHAVEHSLACLLARVDGRSPLEYLDAHGQSRQRKAVLTMLHRPPEKVDQLVDQFTEQLKQ